MELFEHECDIGTLEFLVKILIDQLVNLLELGKSDEALELNEVLRKLSEDWIRAINQGDDFSVLAF